MNDDILKERQDMEQQREANRQGLRLFGWTLLILGVTIFLIGACLWGW